MINSNRGKKLNPPPKKPFLTLKEKIKTMEKKDNKKQEGNANG